MSGLEIVGELLTDDAVFAAAVPAGNFDYWELPQGATVPNVVATRISRTERPLLAGQGSRYVTERIQLTVRANSGAQRFAILAAARDACRNQTGEIAGFGGVAVTLAGDGPDFKAEDEALYMGSTDLRVSFNEPA